MNSTKVAMARIRNARARILDCRKYLNVGGLGQQGGYTTGGSGSCGRKELACHPVMENPESDAEAMVVFWFFPLHTTFPSSVASLCCSSFQKMLYATTLQPSFDLLYLEKHEMFKTPE
eukprot:GHVL01042643.1.p2 GENE.GHVL01042643.1~~GHVL01042643.1.p2  ORF type:complete len:118 (-),score=5.19 GHVL01042643.1:48-401(-)